MSEPTPTPGVEPAGTQTTGAGEPIPGDQPGAAGAVIPGDRPYPRLEHPPSDRFAAAQPPGGSAAQSATAGWNGRALAVLVAAIGALSIVLVAGLLGSTTGLIAIAGATGFLVGLALRAGAAGAAGAASAAGTAGKAQATTASSGATAGSGAASPASLTRTAVVISVGAIVAAVIGTWLLSRLQGGVSGPIDFEIQVLGVLPLVQAAVAAGGAWLAGR